MTVHSGQGFGPAVDPFVATAGRDAIPPAGRGRAGKAATGLLP